ncbi:hypothetical protein OAA99_01240 [Omnitrophica bacterium]|nr:hypothetical protein [Candidatus Omnitrophota bacterium]
MMRSGNPALRGEVLEIIMSKFFRIFIAATIAVFSFSSAAYAGSKNPMLDFYNGLADIIERNMNSPDACVVQSKRFIDENIGSLLESAKRGRQMAPQVSEGASQVSEEEARAAMEKMQNNPDIAREMQASMDALNRFMGAIGNFTAKYPEDAEMINDHMASFEAQFE